MNVIILDSRRHSYVQSPDFERRVMGAEADVTLYHVDDAGQLPQHAFDCDGILSWHLVPLPAQALQRFSRCRAIVRAAVGYDNIDLPRARQQGIQVANVPDYGTEEVADHTLALALALIRKLGACDRAVRAGNWDWRAVGTVPRLRDLFVGLVGLGRIGSAVALRFKALGCRVGFYDPLRPSGWEKALGIERFEHLSALLAASQLVSLHAPLNSATRHLLGHEELQRMQGKWLVNTARGGLVDTQALAAAVAGGTLAGAALDVLETETEAPPTALLCDRVIWSPHMAFYSHAALAELRTKAALCLQQLLRHGTHRNLISPQEGA
ncbi:NAD(P)-dependent oxidoreductase [Pseudomonas typographi]|uniref:NAD(P)-dependent oxidoreductase n=1 Tax=Pseudomonas typographi TaxID=2715964 RepID=UPI00168442AF|nr:C-terminal binding protein [Pseudomonas typographi]